MSNPEAKAATLPQDSSKQINDLVKQIKIDDEGNYTFPEDVELTPELKFAATAEKRRRDTQAEFTKTRQALKAIEAEKEKLKEQLQSRLTTSLSQEQQEELEELKYSDPEMWREKLNKYESEAKAHQREELEGLTGEARKAAELQFELERRQQVLRDFNEHAQIPITDEVIANDVPPRITKKLEDGKITFEDFLSEVSDYLGKTKVVKNEETLNQPSLGNTSGGVTPSKTAEKADIVKDYKNIVF